MAKALSRERIKALIADQIDSANKYSENNLGTQYERALEYYQGLLPKRQNAGSTSFISNDVFDQVETVRSLLLEVFAGNESLIKLQPESAEDVTLSEIASKYINDVLFKQNDGYNVMSSSMLDGLLGRIGPVKYWWEKQTEYEYEEFEDIPEEALDMLLSQDDVELSGEVKRTTVIVDGVEFTTASGEIVREKDVSGIKFESIAPEDFFIDPNVVSVDAAQFVAQRSMKTKSQLIEMGFDKKLLEDVSFDQEIDYNDTDKLARVEDISGGYTIGQDGSGQLATSYTWLYECYAYLDMHDTGEAELYQVFYVKDVILDMQQVDAKPFAVFIPLPMSHRFYGESFVERVIPFQNAKSALIRGVVDSTVRANNPRWQVINGSLTNPRELLDSRMGGIVNVTRPDAVSQLSQPNVNPVAFSTLQWLDESMEDVTGVSDITKGLDDSVLSKQNSRGMVQDVMTVAMMRQRVIAKNFAETFMKPLIKGIYKTLVENDDGEHMLEFRGQFVPITPSEWKPTRGVTIDFEVGYGEREKEAQKLIQAGQLIAQDPDLSMMFGPEQRYKMAKDVFNKMGIMNVPDYLSPQAYQKAEADKKAQGEAMNQERQKQYALEERKLAIREQEVMMGAKDDQEKNLLQKRKQDMQALQQMSKAELDRQKQAHKEALDAIEAAMLAQSTEVNAIVALNN